MLIIDDYLPIEEWIQFNQNEHWEERHRNTWFDCHKEPNNFYEYLSIKVWDMWNEDHKYGCKGYEYWTHIFEENNRLHWHQDKDEYAYRVNNELIHPVMGCILYGEHNDLEGGYLEVQNSDQQIERFEPTPNRLIIFDASKPHRCSEIHAGKRKLWACNLWDVKINSIEDKKQFNKIFGKEPE